MRALAFLLVVVLLGSGCALGATPFGLALGATETAAAAGAAVGAVATYYIMKKNQQGQQVLVPVQNGNGQPVVVQQQPAGPYVQPSLFGYTPKGAAAAPVAADGAMFPNARGCVVFGGAKGKCTVEE